MLETSYQPFERPPDFETLYSLIPRGIRRFFTTFTAVTAKPVNDQYDLFLTATLPTGFAYILRSLVCRVSVDTASDWEDRAELLLTRGIPGQGTTSQVMHVEATLFTPATGAPRRALLARDADLSAFVGPLWSTVPGFAAAFRTGMSNVAAAVGAAGIVDCHVEFYEYDLNQAQRFWVNTPTPVIQR